MHKAPLHTSISEKEALTGNKEIPLHPKSSDLSVNFLNIYFLSCVLSVLSQGCYHNTFYVSPLPEKQSEALELSPEDIHKIYTAGKPQDNMYACLKKENRSPDIETIKYHPIKVHYITLKDRSQSIRHPKQGGYANVLEQINQANKDFDGAVQFYFDSMAKTEIIVEDQTFEEIETSPTLPIQINEYISQQNLSEINVYILPISLYASEERHQSGHVGNFSSDLYNKKQTFIYLSDNSSTVTLAHELGHFFGLLHTFEIEPKKQLSDNSNCETVGDLLCDTAPDPGLKSDSNEQGCEPGGKNCGVDPKDINYSPQDDNLMSYYSYRYNLTPEQKEVIRCVSQSYGEYEDLTNDPASYNKYLSNHPDTYFLINYASELRNKIEITYDFAKMGKRIANYVSIRTSEIFSEDEDFTPVPEISK